MKIQHRQWPRSGKINAELVYTDGTYKVGPPCDTEKVALAAAKKAEAQKQPKRSYARDGWCVVADQSQS
ncbi:hypothetical protein [Pseudomonas sp. GL-R-19]|uniref:hypothetical protein n=1 Tax=Pseudomonas sp. GL-R-19 TaxID=2832391 RepID=UPI001CBB3611|nr:hypothetical protein [Pseudomonas sp. GL-R-19]